MFAVQEQAILIYTRGHNIITRRAWFMQARESLRNPRERKQASVKCLSRFQELVVEYQSSSSSTVCNKMSENDLRGVVLYYASD